MLHGKDPNLVARTQPAHGVRHVQASTLLAHYDGPDVLLRASLNDGVNRVGEEAIDAFLPKHLGDGT